MNPQLTIDFRKPALDVNNLKKVRDPTPEEKKRGIVAILAPPPKPVDK